MAKYYRNGIDGIGEPCILLDNGEVITMDRFVEWLLEKIPPGLDVVDKRTGRDDKGRWRRLNE